MSIRQTGIGLAIAAAAPLAVLWLTEIPLGVPGEWTWSRIPVAPADWTPLILGCFLAAVVGGLYIGTCAVGAFRVAAASRFELAAWLGALWAAGFAWLWALQESPALTQYALGKSGWVLYYHAHEGYFEQARYVMRDVPSYLAGYETQMAEGDYLHLGTHPPGLILFHRVCINLCRASPALCDLLERTQPPSFRDAMEVIERLERTGPRPITGPDRAALWLAVLITQAIAAAGAWPIYLLVRRTHSPTASWWAAALWPLVPALAVFLPKSDALLPFLGALCLWAWLEGLRRGRLSLCALAGALFWLAMFLSLAVLPIALAAASLTLWESFFCSPEERTSPRLAGWAARIAAAAAGWGFFLVLLWFLGRINLVSVWLANLRNHAAFYDHYPRTYWKWLIEIPLELLFAVGAPLVVAVGIGFCTSVAAGWRRRAMGPYWCLTATMVVLWLTGKNMGEAARLWLVFMPWAVWLAAGFIAPDSDAGKTAGGASLRARRALLILILQMAVCIGTVTRVTGFDFPVVPDSKDVTVRERLPEDRLATLATRAILPIAR